MKENPDWKEAEYKPHFDVFSAKFTRLPPERWHGANLWPWWARWNYRLRVWYQRRHPEKFGLPHFK